MRAGKLDRIIFIERATPTIAEDGAPTTTWAPLATMRAQLVKRADADIDARHGSRDRHHRDLPHPLPRRRDPGRPRHLRRSRLRHRRGGRTRTPGRARSPVLGEG